MLLPDKVNVPAPALVTANADAPSLIIPVIELVPAFVTLNVPEDEIAAAVNISVVIVILPKALDPPTAPLNVVSPVPLEIVNVLPVVSPFKVLEKVMSLFVVVRVVLAPKVTPPV